MASFLINLIASPDIWGSHFVTKQVSQIILLIFGEVVVAAAFDGVVVVVVDVLLQPHYPSNM